MPLPPFLDRLSEARVRWLRGEADAWTQYAACCLRIDAEVQRASRPAPSTPEPAITPRRIGRRRRPESRTWRGANGKRGPA